MFKKFKKLTVKSDNSDIDRLQDNVEAAIGPLTTVEIVQGRLIRNIQLTAGTSTAISHKLNRNPLSWVVCAKNANANIWATTSQTPALTLILTCDVNVTIDLWVF